MRAWWTSLSGGDKLTWAVVLIGFLLYFTGNLNVPTDYSVR